MIFSAVLMTLLAVPAAGGDAYINHCGDEVRSDKIVKPWAKNAALYDNGNVGVALLDMGNSVDTGLTLLLLHSPRFDASVHHCWIIRPKAEEGFSQVDFSAHEVKDGPNNELILMFRVKDPSEAESQEGWSMLSVTVDQQYGNIETSFSK